MKKTANVKPIQPAAKSVPAKPELAPIQQLIADEVADMLVHGGDSETTDMLIAASAHHHFWRWANNLWGPDNQDQTSEDTVAKLSERTIREWTSEMLALWRANHGKAPDAKGEPKTAAERIRARVLDELRGLFDTFLVRGTPEEHRLLVEIFRDHESGTHGADAFDELPLGQAFEYAIGSAAPEYLMVPYWMREQVQRYIDCLEAAHAKDRRSAA